MAEGRVDLGIAFDRFVVAPDDSPRARLARFAARMAWRWKRGQVRLRRVARHLVSVRATAGRAFLLPQQARAVIADGFVAMRDAAVLLVLILRYAMSRPLHASEAEHQIVRHSRKSAFVIGLAVLALALALLLPEPERQAMAIQPEPAVVAARAPEPAPQPAPNEIRRSPEPALPPEQRPWQPVRQPIVLYHVESPELSGLSLAYRVAQRDRSRQDTLTWQPKSDSGEVEARRSSALLVVERHEGHAPTEKPLFADLAARAAEHRLVIERMARPQDIRTKFGPVEAAELTLRHENGVAACLAFRRIDMVGVTLVGWLCGTPQRPVDRVSMSCFVDRLDLVAGGRDTTLRKFFAEAERSRQNCSTARQTGRKLTWMDHEAPVPPLKLTARR